eukprot:scaffold35686_cov76-Phaeocystis_antarctica.AAC.2
MAWSWSSAAKARLREATCGAVTWKPQQYVPVSTTCMCTVRAEAPSGRVGDSRLEAGKGGARVDLEGERVLVDLVVVPGVVPGVAEPLAFARLVPPIVGKGRRRGPTCCDTGGEVGGEGGEVSQVANRHLYVKSVCARAARGVSVRGMHGGWVGSGVSAAAVVWKMRRGLT